MPLIGSLSPLTVIILTTKLGPEKHRGRMGKKLQARVCVTVKYQDLALFPVSTQVFRAAITQHLLLLKNCLPTVRICQFRPHVLLP